MLKMYYIFGSEITTLSAETLSHVLGLLHFWAKSYHPFGFYYTSGPKVTTRLVLTTLPNVITFLGITDKLLNRNVEKIAQVVLVNRFAHRSLEGIRIKKYAIMATVYI